MDNKNTFKNSVEAIGSLNSLIAVMQHYNINFKKDNSGFFTNCVFHNDKNPSMRLTNKGGKALYNCFGCGAKGDIINFICEMENWIKICTVRLVKFPELCYYFQYVRVQFVHLAARLLHKKNNVVSRCAKQANPAFPFGGGALCRWT